MKNNKKNKSIKKLLEHRFSRIFNILSFLSPYSQITIRDLAKEFGVSERTIRRDLNILLNAKLGITYFNGKIKITSFGYKKIKEWIIS